MSRRILTILAATVGMVAVTWGLGIGFSRYTHPDLQNRSTEELRWEVIALNRDHIDQPALIRLPCIARQAYISAELAERTKAQVLVWQAEDKADQDPRNQPDLATEYCAEAE
jgi:hypothetical protein